MEANVQGELHLASQMLRLADARDSRLRFCSDLNSFGDCSAETIPEGVENRQHIFLTALDMSGAVFDGPGLCWRSKRLRACPYLLTDPGEPGERTYLCLLILVTLQPTTVKKPPGISRSLKPPANGKVSARLITTPLWPSAGTKPRRSRRSRCDRSLLSATSHTENQTTAPLSR